MDLSAGPVALPRRTLSWRYAPFVTGWGAESSSSSAPSNGIGPLSRVRKKSYRCGPWMTTLTSASDAITSAVRPLLAKSNGRIWPLSEVREPPLSGVRQAATGR